MLTYRNAFVSHACHDSRIPCTHNRCHWKRIRKYGGKLYICWSEETDRKHIQCCYIIKEYNSQWRNAALWIVWTVWKNLLENILFALRSHGWNESRNLEAVFKTVQKLQSFERRDCWVSIKKSWFASVVNRLFLVFLLYYITTCGHITPSSITLMCKRVVVPFSLPPSSFPWR